MSGNCETPVDGLVRRQGTQGQAKTVVTVLASLAKRGIPLLARIDHAAAARAAGLSLPPTELLIFGSAVAGTPLMIAHDTIAIDLPLKLLVQEAPDGRASLSYNDPGWIAQRHGLSPECDATIMAMRTLLAAIVDEATATA